MIASNKNQAMFKMLNAASDASLTWHYCIHRSICMQKTSHMFKMLNTALDMMWLHPLKLLLQV